jgi:hypothetical protein
LATCIIRLSYGSGNRADAAGTHWRAPAGLYSLIQSHSCLCVRFTSRSSLYSKVALFSVCCVHLAVLGAVGGGLASNARVASAAPCSSYRTAWHCCSRPLRPPSLAFGASRAGSLTKFQSPWANRVADGGATGRRRTPSQASCIRLLASRSEAASAALSSSASCARFHDNGMMDDSAPCRLEDVPQDIVIKTLKVSCACVPVLVFARVFVCVCVRATSICVRENLHLHFLIFVCVCMQQGRHIAHKFESAWEDL